MKKRVISGACWSSKNGERTTSRKEQRSVKEEWNDRVVRVVFNQNVFQLILQLGRCSLALAHTRDDIASSAMHVINIMMTDWNSCGTASAQ